MDPVTGAIVSNIGGELLGGLFGSSSAKKQNKAAAEAAERANAFTREQMQNRHQWEVADLRAAGLNPILSAGGTPSMGGSSAAPVVGETEHFASSARSIGKAPLERQIAMATLDNLTAQADQASAAAENQRAQAALTNTQNVQKSVFTSVYKAAGDFADKATNKFKDRVQEIQKLPQTFRDQIRKHREKGTYKWK